MLDKMNCTSAEEIRKTYEELGSHEAFRVFADEQIDPEEVRRVIGTHEALGYANYFYFSPKRGEHAAE